MVLLDIFGPDSIMWCVRLSQVHITQYADSVASHLAKILDSDKHSDVISSAKYVPPAKITMMGRAEIDVGYAGRKDYNRYVERENRRTEMMGV